MTSLITLTHNLCLQPHENLQSITNLINLAKPRARKLQLFQKKEDIYHLEDVNRPRFESWNSAVSREKSRRQRLFKRTRRAIVYCCRGKEDRARKPTEEKEKKERRTAERRGSKGHICSKSRREERKKERNEHWIRKKERRV